MPSEERCSRSLILLALLSMKTKCLVELLSNCLPRLDPQMSTVETLCMCINIVPIQKKVDVIELDEIRTCRIQKVYIDIRQPCFPQKILTPEWLEEAGCVSTKLVA